MARWNEVCFSCKHSWIEVYPDGDEIKCHLECLTEKNNKGEVKSIEGRTN